MWQLNLTHVPAQMKDAEQLWSGTRMNCMYWQHAFTILQNFRSEQWTLALRSGSLMSSSCLWIWVRAPTTWESGPCSACPELANSQDLKALCSTLGATTTCARWYTGRIWKNNITNCHKPVSKSWGQLAKEKAIELRGHPNQMRAKPTVANNILSVSATPHYCTALSHELSHELNKHGRCKHTLLSKHLGQEKSMIWHSHICTQCT